MNRYCPVNLLHNCIAPKSMYSPTTKMLHFPLSLRKNRTPQKYPPHPLVNTL